MGWHGGGCSTSGHTGFEVLPGLQKAIPLTVELRFPDPLSVSNFVFKRRWRVVQKFRCWEKQEPNIDKIGKNCVCVF